MEKFENDYGLNFNNTFPPTLTYFYELIDLSKNNDNFLTKEEISMYTAIPTGASTGKVIPHIYYGKYMGILDFLKEKDKFKIIPTRLGEIIYKEDPIFAEAMTQLICHIRITSIRTGAPLWCTLFRRVFPENNNVVSEGYMIEAINYAYRQMKNDISKVEKKKLGPLLSCYTDSFSKLNFFEHKGETFRLKPLSLGDEYIYGYAYALFYLWDLLYGVDTDEIVENDLLALGIKEIFGWDNENFNEFLESLQNREIIRFNRQITPYTVIRMRNTESIENKMYSLLF
ncbi:MAG: hypothetical protein K6G26_13260 [Lachnospiraceae bacterium]|nr:hypothetical protein [Lachnospiraceae bacterium]